MARPWRGWRRVAVPVQDIVTRPSKEVIYIDVDRKVPVHETLTSLGDGKVFEIDFSDYIEVEPGQWAPRSIRIESKDYFTCEYRFELVAGTHWMLEEVVSRFKPQEKSRGVIEDVPSTAEGSSLTTHFVKSRRREHSLAAPGNPSVGSM